MPTAVRTTILENTVISDRGPKVRLVASSTTWIEGEALRQLDASSSLTGMRFCAGMPDLNPGKGGPVGAAFLSEGYIHPALIGSDAGCGISFAMTGIRMRKVRAHAIAALLEGLDRPWDGDTAAFLIERGISPGPHDASLGTPGRGNHFIELQEVDHIVDEELFDRLGLDKRFLHLTVHSGSRGLGEAILRTHTAVHGGAPIAANTPAAVSFMAAHDNAVNWAAANREVCAIRVCEALGTDRTQVLDICHNSVIPVDHCGCACWLHRKGAAPADKGLVLIPGSRGDLSWLVRPSGNGAGTLDSLAHGAGRKLARHEAKGKLRGLYRRADLLKNPWGGEVICGDDNLAWEEAPEAYKPVASVVGDLFAAGLAFPIAAFRPVVTFKTSRNAEDGTGGRRPDWKEERRLARQAARGGMFR
jgi:release factor H-coupled RctB family protein